VKAELYTGRLIRIDDDKLVFAAKETGGAEESFAHQGLNINEAWINTFLGAWVECKIH
jgi:hypothetical protein